MSQFRLHTIETAPDGSKELLRVALKQNGFVPNLYAIMAESPEVLKAYRQMADLFEKTAFNPIEKNIVWLTISYNNKCHYCMAIHSLVAQMYKVPDQIIESLRNNLPLKDSKLEALRKFTALMVEKRGWVSDEELQAFLAAGYAQKNVLDVIVGIGQKIISNYVNHVTHTPLDPKIEGFKWEAPTAGCERNH